jgi:hypothetical protein
VPVTTGAGTGGKSLVELSEELAGAMSVPVDGAGPVDPSADPEEDVTAGVAGSVVGVLPVSDPFGLVTTGVGVPGRSLVELPEELAGAMSVPVDEAVLVDPSADPEEDVTSGVAGSVAGVLFPSDPLGLVTTGVGVGDRSLVELPEEIAGVMSVPVDEAVLVDPSADPEADVISGEAGSVVGVLPVSVPPVVVTTGVGVEDRVPSGPSA